MNFKILIQSLSKNLNYEIRKYPADLPLRRRMDLLNHYKIMTIFDIGANAGQYASEMRDLGFTGTIYSFEPQSDAFKNLENNRKKDKLWKGFNYAMGDFEGTTEINISGNSYSSSLLEMMPEHLNSAPESKYIRKESIQVKTLDTVLPDLTGSNQGIFLKIDTQGYEKQVLEGGKKVLNQVTGVQVEMSMVPLYKGDCTFEVMNDYLNTLGFYLCSIENEFENPTNHKILQVNGMYFRC